MKLTLDRDDLKDEYKDIPCRNTDFIHFKSDVQRVISIVGRATFREWSGDNYNAILPKKEDK